MELLDNGAGPDCAEVELVVVHDCSKDPSVTPGNVFAAAHRRNA